MGQDQLVGRTIGGRFRIESLIGEGAMGRVYRARQVTLGTSVALKVLHEELARLPAIEARFLREAQAASRIDHPSSVRMIDFGKEPDGLLYLAMELIDGRSLADTLAESGPLAAARIIEIASQVLAALAVAHELGVVHRDLKPENIMVVGVRDDDGNPCDLVKVCDFGIAKIVDGKGAAPSVTQEGVILGTPAYMSPEQARGEPLDARSDVYSMGVLLFQMMTGEVPFDATSAFGTALMHVTDEPTKPTLLVPTIDSRLEAICLKAMRKRPEDRYASARELRAELRALLALIDLDAGASLRRPSSPPVRAASAGSIAPTTLLAQVESPRGRGSRAVLGIALGGAALAAAFLFGKGGPSTPSPAPPMANAATPAEAAPKVTPQAPSDPPASPAAGPEPQAPSLAEAAASSAPAPSPRASTASARRVLRAPSAPVPKAKGVVRAAARTAVEPEDVLPAFVSREPEPSGVAQASSAAAARVPAAASPPSVSPAAAAVSAPVPATPAPPPAELSVPPPLPLPAD
jgi:serine/threonine protein kinase